MTVDNNDAASSLLLSPIGFPPALRAPTSAGCAEMDDTTKFYCQYRSKRCWNLRALKQNGVMHKLCEIHRDRANINQRRLEKRRRARRGAQLMDGGYVYPQDVKNDIKLLQEILPPAPTKASFGLEVPLKPSILELCGVTEVPTVLLPATHCINIAFDSLEAVPSFDAAELHHLSKSPEKLLSLHDAMVWTAAGL